MNPLVRYAIEQGARLIINHPILIDPCGCMKTPKKGGDTTR